MRQRPLIARLYCFMEVWKKVVGFENYQVSNLGRVKNLNYDKERFLTPNKGTRGYMRVNLSKKGKVKTVSVHILSALCFLDSDYLNKKLHCNHIDGNKSNNKLNNLEVVTKSENEKHAFRIGLKSHKWENHNRRKLNLIQVNEIRNKLINGSTIKELAILNNVSISCISSIKHNRSWS